MATKWKNFTRNSWVKAVSWLLILAMTAASAGMTVYAMYMTQQEATEQITPYSYSLSFPMPDVLTHETPTADYFALMLYEPLSELYSAEETGSTAESIQNNVKPADLLDALVSQYEESDDAAKWDADEMLVKYDDDTPTLDTETVNAVMTAFYRSDYNGYDDYAMTEPFENWLLHHPAAYEACRTTYVDKHLRNIADLKEEWQPYQSAFAYYTINEATGDVITSLPDGTTQEEAEAQLLSSAKYAVSLKTTNSRAEFHATDSDTEQALKAVSSPDYTLDGDRNGTAIGAITVSAYNQILASWSRVHEQMFRLFVVYAISAVVIALCLIVLCFGAGRKPDDSERYLIGFDHIWTEAQIVLGICACLAFAGVIAFFLNYFGDATVSLSVSLTCASVCAASAAFAAVCLTIFLSQVRRIKARQWLNGWIIWRLFRKFGIASVQWLYRQFHKSPLRRRFIILSIVIPLLCTVWIPVPFVIILLLIASIRLADSIETVTRGAHDIRTGKTDTNIAVPKSTPKELCALADDLNGISEGLHNAVDTAVKSERLKSELISNVSHDIKTPLTSIVTYVDLLKQCDIPDETAQEYLRVIDQKAQRLRTLTLDLFDASKATSGAMQVELAKTDLDALLRQALGERSEHIQRAGLDLRITSHPPVYVHADGRLLWRVLDNLISNCVRYAVPHSRVYVDIAQTDTMCVLTMKNISATELNISAEELMQRFTRGDRSRHTEGSGLGLSIAQSLTELMHGSCRVEIDGDLFKAIVEIPRWTQPETQETNQTT